MIKAITLFFFLLSFFSDAQQGKTAVLGKWMAADKSVAVHVYQQGKDFKAKVIWLNESLGSGLPMHSRLDSKNPDSKLRNRKIVGMDILEGLHYNAEKDRWEDGKIYDASSGKIWDTFAEIKKNGQLYVRGFWKYSWIGKTLHFYRY